VSYIPPASIDAPERYLNFIIITPTFYVCLTIVDAPFGPRLVNVYDRSFSLSRCCY